MSGEGNAAGRRPTRGGFVRGAAALLVVLSGSGLACGDECLAFEHWPPSARFRIVDASTGEAFCDPGLAMEANRGRPIPLEELCEWRLPEWITEQGLAERADVAEVTLSLPGYAPATVSVPVTRDGCGAVRQPATIDVSLEPE